MIVSRLRRYESTPRRITRQLLIVASLLTGCTARITPPADLSEPTTVFIADYGQHASLILPRPSGDLAEYAYGEWGWFALNRTGWYWAAPAIALPTPGTLGTRELRGPATAAGVRSQVGLEHLHDLQVERAAIDALLAELDGAFARNQYREVFNKELGLRFVPYEQPYCLFCQCNSLVARWLRQLGCRVEGPALMAEFEVVARRDEGDSP